MGRAHVGTFCGLYPIRGTSSLSRDTVGGIRNSRHQVSHSMTTVTFPYLILPTVSIVGSKRSKDEPEKMWWMLGGEGVLIVSAFYYLNLVLIGNLSSTSWISSLMATMTIGELSSCTIKILKCTRFVVPTPFALLTLEFHVICLMVVSGWQHSTHKRKNRMFSLFSFFNLGSAWSYFNIFAFILLGIFN